ncbi:MAG TPA: hypothetical protein VHF91_04255 [Acidimicrobiales bacterium]|nr:hypothetical protein [Acidimicrobiales bacterium]
MRKALLVALLLVVVGCSSQQQSGAPVTTVPRPPVSDEEELVNRVLVGLDGVMGDLQRILVRERGITPEVTDRLQAIYTGPELLNQIDAFRTDVANGLAGYKAVPGNRVTTVARLITVSPICIFAEVVRDYGPVAEGPPPTPAGLYVILVTKHEGDDPRQLNPTPWAMLYDGVQVDGSQPEDVCR